MIRRLPTLAALAAAAALAACSGGDAEQPEMPENEAENVVIVDEMPSENIVEAEPTPTPSATPTPIAQDLPTEEQVMEDAEAVGMTARLPRSDGNEAAPAE